MTEVSTGAEVRRGPLGVVTRWWPALVGLIAVASLLDDEPWRPSDPTTVILPVLALMYLVFGAVRRQYGRPGVLRLEIIGLAIFGAWLAWRGHCAHLAALVAAQRPVRRRRAQDDVLGHVLAVGAVELDHAHVERVSHTPGGPYAA